MSAATAFISTSAGVVAPLNKLIESPWLMIQAKQRAGINELYYISEPEFSMLLTYQ